MMDKNAISEASAHLQRPKGLSRFKSSQAVWALVFLVPLLFLLPPMQGSCQNGRALSGLVPRSFAKCVTAMTKSSSVSAGLGILIRNQVVFRHIDSSTLPAGLIRSDSTLPAFFQPAAELKDTSGAEPGPETVPASLWRALPGSLPIWPEMTVASSDSDPAPYHDIAAKSSYPEEKISPAVLSPAPSTVPDDTKPETTLNPPIRQVAVSEKLIALTLDDGPYPGMTQQCLAALAAKNAKATFFLVGTRAQCYGDTVTQIAREGHEIGNHSLRHADLGSGKKSAALADLEETNNLLEKLCGRKPLVFRPPYGSWNQSLLKAAAKTGVIPVTWDIDPRDWKNPPPQAIIDHVMENIHPGAIVLLHEGHPHTAEALPGILEALEKEGYRTVTVSELLAAGSRQRS